MAKLYASEMACRVADEAVPATSEKSKSKSDSKTAGNGGFFLGLTDLDCLASPCAGSVNLTVLKADNTASCTQTFSFSG